MVHSVKWLLRKLRTEWKTNASGQNSPHQNGSSASGSMYSEESACVNIDDEWSEPLDVDENIKLPYMYPALKQSLLKAFKLMDKELKLHPTIDCFCSGTTAVTVIKQVWDVLSNKEVVDIIASAPTRATAARALVECAVRVWRLKFPTSKIDDCAVVCLFLDPPPPSAYPPQESDANKTSQEQHVEVVAVSIDKEETNNMERDELVPEGPHSYTADLEQSNAHHDADDEIVPVSEEPVTEKLPGRSNSTRSLADCMSATEEEEWSALDGVTRVNSLVNLPRFSSTNKGPTGRKKWL